MSELPVPATPATAPPVAIAGVRELPAPQTLVCANCGQPLAGEYCAACGQRHEPHVHTVSHFAGEAFESI
jgi:predicted amidophosphoribosyltransferase